eukprot:08939.XXX_379668_379820_1 [CDS] Oithona nana genome sequencing.
MKVRLQQNAIKSAILNVSSNDVDFFFFGAFDCGDFLLKHIPYLLIAKMIP